MNEKKTKIIALRIDDILLKKLKDNAKKEKRTLSNYIYIILEGIKQ